MPEKVYFGSLFLRRFLKYLLPLALSLLLTPLLAEAYRTTCDKSLEATQGYAEEALRQLEEQILASQELSSFLLSERTLLNLNLTKTGAAEIFLLFRDNDNFISNYISSDDFRTVYPRMLEYPGMTAEQRRENLIWLADRSGNLLITHNAGGQPMPALLKMSASPAQKNCCGRPGNPTAGSYCSAALAVKIPFTGPSPAATESPQRMAKESGGCSGGEGVIIPLGKEKRICGSASLFSSLSPGNRRFPAF